MGDEDAFARRVASVALVAPPLAGTVRASCCAPSPGPGSTLSTRRCWRAHDVRELLNDPLSHLGAIDVRLVMSRSAETPLTGAGSDREAPSTSTRSS